MEVPFAAQSVPFNELIETGKIPNEYLVGDYIIEQFVERLVHYILSVSPNQYTMPKIAALLEQLDSKHQVFFFKKLKETSPNSLKHFAPLYYGFMAEFHPLLFT